MSISRRQFIITGIGGMIGLAAGGAYLISKEAPLLPELLLHLKKKKASFAPIASVHANLVKKKRISVDPPEQLAQRLNTMLNRCARTNDAPDAYAAFKQCISKDFKDDNLIAIDGWLLSKTEVEVYSLLSKSA